MTDCSVIPAAFTALRYRCHAVYRVWRRRRELLLMTGERSVAKVKARLEPMQPKPISVETSIWKQWPRFI